MKVENQQNVTVDLKTVKNVLAYIKNTWEKSIRSANDTVPYPYTSPSTTGGFKAFFYWDNYFIHKGIMLDGLDKQVKHNLDNFKYFIEKFGYMPNASNLLTRSQPPLYARCVYEYYLFKKDTRILLEYLPTILQEYKFWMTERILPCGLNTYFCTATRYQLKSAYDRYSSRVEEYRDDEEAQISVAEDILALAESGLDFNIRFVTNESKIDAKKFIHLDINCFMYDMEKTISNIYTILQEENKALEFEAFANKRKEMIDQYLFDRSQGIYLDYNFVDGCFSRIISAVSLYPYTYGISGDQEGAKKVLKELELPFGISPCAFRGDDAFYFQWDYPCVWPYTTWFAYTALNNVGLHEDAERIAKKYLVDVNINFEKTGIIWEKYDGRNGEIAVTCEYETPEMLGWSAGVYRVFAEELYLNISK